MPSAIGRVLLKRVHSGSRIYVTTVYLTPCQLIAFVKIGKVKLFSMTHVAIHVITTSHIDGGITLVTASTFTKHIQTPFG
jgi:hypothetical protein